MAKSILIVEDDALLLKLEKDNLESKGYKILTAIDSVETFKILDSNTKIDLILLDLLLPGMDGFEILQKIRETKVTENISVIVFSNLSEDKDIERVSKLHINEYIVKSSITLKDIAEKVKKILGE